MGYPSQYETVDEVFRSGKERSAGNSSQAGHEGRRESASGSQIGM